MMGERVNIEIGYQLIIAYTASLVEWLNFIYKKPYRLNGPNNYFHII